MKIRSIAHFNKIPNFQELNTKKQEKIGVQNPISSNVVLNYMNYTSIPFMGREKVSFVDTISDNYFKLPKIKTKNGNIIQAYPDKTQLACAESLYEGNSTVCIAPTGTGKTAIANYVITKNLKDDKKTIYTTPLKALSNDKYREFCKLYGDEKVGLLTGDIKLNKDAPIVIMTTEIYRNMALGAYAKNSDERFDGVKTVIFDEAHYIAEHERGRIWEESIMLTPSSVQILPLSATIGNGLEFASWIENVTDRKTNLVEASPKDRHVPLVYYNYVGLEKGGFQELIKGKVNIKAINKNFENDSLSQRQIRAIDMLYQIKNNKDDDYVASKEEQKEILDILNFMTHSSKTPHLQFADLLRKEFRLKEIKAQEITQLLIDSDSKSINDFETPKNAKVEKKNDYKNLVRALKSDNKLPALVFIFSKANCNDASAILADGGLNLTTQKEKEEIQKIIDNYKEKGIYLGKEFSERELLQGVAVHHAGLLPAHKKLVEELFSKKLVKTVFATSTLSAGINMPAKTVVITSVDRPTRNQFGGIDYVPLTANEFHQMSGRAGRRGIDTIGNVVLYKLTNKDAHIAKDLILKAPDKAKSSFSPSYSFLPAYYQRCEDDSLLDYFQRNTLKVYQAENKHKTLVDLKEDFEKYRQALVELNFLEPTEKGYRPTLKGQMLTKAHGYNQLAIVDVIFSGFLEQLNPIELASFAAAMTSEKQDRNNKDKDEMIFAQNLMEMCKKSDDTVPLIDSLMLAFESDDRKNEVEKEHKIKNYSDYKTGIFEAWLAYNWAYKNSENPEKSTNNFKMLGREFVGKKAKGKALSLSSARRFEDGNIYRILAQSTDVLKQIINISEFAIENEYPNKKYYENLIQTATKAVELIKHPPMYDASAVGNNENN